MNSLDIRNSFAAKEEIEMGSSYEDIRNERQWKVMAVLTQAEFASLSLAFGTAYELIHGVTLHQSLANLGKAGILSTYEDCLYFTLFQLKTAQSFDCLGVLFNIDGSSAHRSFTKYLQVVELALKQQGALPRRSFAHLAEFRNYLQDEEELIADATELRTERPADKDKSQQYYSGKKKRIR
jgi:hypothetical protein